MFRAEYISPNDPLPIFRTNRYLPPTVKSDLDEVLALAIMKKNNNNVLKIVYIYSEHLGIFSKTTNLIHNTTENHIKHTQT